MYAVKLQLTDGQATSSNGAAASTSSQPKATSTYASALSGTVDSVEAVDVWAGNPRVEHLVGQVHLYRCSTEGKPRISQDLPTDRGATVCVLSLPLDLSVSDFCQFMGAHLEQVQQMRFMQREGARAPCLVAISFREQSLADQFFRHFNARPFSSLEPLELCHVVFVKDVVIAEGLSDGAHLPLPGQVELPSCPVCLEKLDESAGIVTTVCNHQFHNLCLQRWGDTSCPVCRYVANSEASTSHCEECGSSQDVWICLICGRVGCGRYQQGHAVDHWRASGHCYSLELQSQRVWDYAGDGYVHRLVQSKTGGKLVEVPSPQSGPAGSTSESSESQAALQAALMTSKMDALALEFNHLLVSQLDSQRHYYEGLLAQRQEASFKETSAAKALEAATCAGAVNDREALLRAEQSRKALEQKAAAATAQAKAVAKERDDLQALNDQVMRNQVALRQQTGALQAENGSLGTQVKDLEEQVRDLMVFIEAQQHVASHSELQGGGVSTPKPPDKRRASRNKR